MLRRLILGLVALFVCAAAIAQQKPAEGMDYTYAQSAAIRPTPPGKVEVIEFFWYRCPHCYNLEPVLAGLGEETAARRAVPAAYRRYSTTNGRSTHACSSRWRPR